MTSVVPLADHRLAQVMLIAQCAQARGAQQEVSSGRWFQPQPAGGEHPQEMAAGKKQHVALEGSHPAQHAVSPRAYLVRRFTSGATVAEQLPIRALSIDLGRASALVLAVVPFDQIAIHFGDGPEAGQLTGPCRALQGARKHLREIQSDQSFPERAGVLLAVLRQRQIGKPRMLTGEAPRRFAVSGQVSDRKFVAHHSVLAGTARTILVK